jgi:hypothetical protein
MHKQRLLRTFVALAVLMLGLSSHAGAQTYRPSALSNNPYEKMKDALMAARAAAARAARSNPRAKLPRSKAVGYFLTFDAPGAVKATITTAVSASGIIAGQYYDANNARHGFLRAPWGAFYTFDVPGAGDAYPAGVNDFGVVTGSYSDAVSSGSFLRAPDGKITTFNTPGATAAVNLTPGATAVNLDGTVVGNYYDENFISHGFLRTPSGRIITVDAPGTTGGTFPVAITADGSVLGTAYPSTSSPFFNGQVGFLRTASGRFTAITGPGGLVGQDDVINSAGPPLSINPSGEIAGTYFQPISGNPYGGDFRVFLRSRAGKYVTFDAANYSPCCIFSSPSGINFAGTVTGSFNDGFGIYHGFWRTPSGKVTTFDVPAAGTGINEGTLPIGITALGIIAGYYVDANNIYHGFLFLPKSSLW